LNWNDWKKERRIDDIKEKKRNTPKIFREWESLGSPVDKPNRNYHA
jgi:hypothetical protein